MNHLFINVMNVRRRQIDPNFVIPASHANRWQAVPEDDSSDSAMSSVDSDEGELVSFTLHNEGIL